MIHVCSLARLYETVEATGARHVVTLLKDTDRVERPSSVVAANHLILSMDDISVPMDGYTLPCDDHVSALVEFVRGWNRAKPLVVHCYAGISRSTAGAYVAACALNPCRDELTIARELRRASATATPNSRFTTSPASSRDYPSSGSVSCCSVSGGFTSVSCSRALEPFRLDPAREKGHGQWPEAFRPVKHGCKFRWDGAF